MEKVVEHSWNDLKYVGQKIVECREKIEKLLEAGFSLSSEEMVCLGKELDCYVLQLEKREVESYIKVR